MEKRNTNVSSSLLSLAELANLLGTLSEEYNTTIPAILHKLDAVSGDLNALHRLLGGDKNVEWSKDEDDMLLKNPDLLKRWKGAEASETRKKYLQHKVK